MKRKLFSYILLTKRERSKLEEIYNKESEKCKDSLSVWFTFAVIGNLLPVIVAFALNLVINDDSRWLEYLNNGTISLVGYNIVISAIFYLLDTTKPSHESLKKKVLGIGIIMLFLNISMFTFQATALSFMTCMVLGLSFLISLFLLSFTTASGRYMVILQKEIVGAPKDHGEVVKQTRQKVSEEPSDSDEGIEY